MIKRRVLIECAVAAAIVACGAFSFSRGAEPAPAEGPVYIRVDAWVHATFVGSFGYETRFPTREACLAYLHTDKFVSDIAALTRTIAESNQEGGEVQTGSKCVDPSDSA